MPKDSRLYMTFPIDFCMKPQILPLTDASFRGWIKSIAWVLVNSPTHFLPRAARISNGTTKRSARELEAAKLWRADLKLDGHWVLKDIWDGWVDGGYRKVIPIERRLEVLERDGHKCKHCGAIDGLEMDHVYPWSLGGSDEIENLQTLCGPCNRKKAATV